MHVHLASTLPYDAHDTRVGYGTLHCQRLLVQLLQPLGVFLLSVHLDFKSVHLKQLSALLQVLSAIRILARPTWQHPLLLVAKAQLLRCCEIAV